MVTRRTWFAAAIVDDGTTADSLGCEPLVNGADIAGKIAIVYRGTCEFGMKALNAQNAGAVAVVIVNNIPGPPVGMAGGTSGASVSIPVVMISQDAGALIHDEVVAGNVEMFIGSVQNMFQANVSLAKASTRSSTSSSSWHWFPPVPLSSRYHWVHGSSTSVATTSRRDLAGHCDT